MGQSAGPGDLDGHIMICRKPNYVGQIGERFWRRQWLGGLGPTDMINNYLGFWMAKVQLTQERQNT